MDTAIFLCTPELVGSWLFYPAWLCSPHMMPQSLVMDYTDVERTMNEASSLRATPYDVLVWETLRTYVDFRFLEAHRPDGPSLLSDGSRKIRYENQLSPADMTEIRTNAKSIVDSLRGGSNEQMNLIVKHGYLNWRKFGLELKKNFKFGDSVFLDAIKNTDDELSQIERGFIPIDAELLVRRYLLKLQVGLLMRKVYSRIRGIPKSRFRVFDTPEYLPAAKLLVKHGFAKSEDFAIPTEGPEKNEARILEILKIDDDTTPLRRVDVELLQRAVGQLKTELDAGVSPVEISERLGREVEQVRKRLIYQGGGLAVGVSSVILSSEITRVTGLFDIPGEARAIMQLLGYYFVLKNTQNKISESLERFDSATRFIVTREMLYGFNPMYKMKSLWTSYLLRLARYFSPRPKTMERISRQMMRPWVATPTWYDIR